VERIERDVAVLKQDVAELKQDVTGLKKDMNYLNGQFDRFKEWEFERTVRERYPAYLGRLLRKAKLRTFEELLEWVSEAEDKGLLSPEEAEEILRLDLVIEGELKHSRKPVFLAVEVSVSLYPEDLDRALRRADLLFRILQKEVIPVVVFTEGKEELEGLAQEKGVLALKVPY